MIYKSDKEYFIEINRYALEAFICNFVFCFRIDNN